MAQREMQAVVAELERHIGRLEDSSPAVRAAAAQAICREAYREASELTGVLLKDSRLIDRLIELVSDPDEAVRGEAVAALAAIASARAPLPKIFAPLLGKLQDKSPKIREWAVVGIGAFEARPDRWSALVPSLSDPASSVRIAACRAFAFAHAADMGGSLHRQVSELLERLQGQDRSAKVRAAARNALEVMG